MMAAESKDLKFSGPVFLAPDNTPNGTRTREAERVLDLNSGMGWGNDLTIADGDNATLFLIRGSGLNGGDLPFNYDQDLCQLSAPMHLLM